MLDELQNIRYVIEKAVELGVTGAGSALLDFKKVHTALLIDDDANEDIKAIDEDAFNG